MSLYRDVFSGIAVGVGCLGVLTATALALVDWRMQSALKDRAVREPGFLKFPESLERRARAARKFLWSILGISVILIVGGLLRFV